MGHQEVRCNNMERMNDDIRRAVRVRLAEKDWNQARLARELGMHPQYLSRLLAGKAGKIPASWLRVFEELDLELVAKKKTHDND